MKKKACIFVAAVVASFVGKILLAQLGYNYDIESYKIVSDIVLKGGTVYAETARYNYGPPWFLITGGIGWIHAHWFPSSGMEGFHLLFAAFLSLVDIALAALTWWVFGLGGALLFLLNPISFLITGYHSQFDNLAILAAFAAVLALTSARTERQFWAGLVLLGGSLMIKHVFIFFPIWLCFWQLERDADRTRALLILVLPVVIFLLPFCLYGADPAARSGIIRNVVFYHSEFNSSLFAYLIGIFVPIPPLLGRYALVPVGFLTLFLWMTAMVFVGFTVRKKTPIELFLFYTLAMVALAPAMTDQYLAIPVLGVCVLLTWRMKLWYFILALLFLLLPGSHNWNPEILSRLIPHGAIYRWQCLVPLLLVVIVEVIRLYRRGEWSFDQWKVLVGRAVTS